MPGAVDRLILKFKKIADPTEDCSQYEIIEDENNSQQPIMSNEELIPQLHHEDCTGENCVFFGCKELSRKNFESRVNIQANHYLGNNFAEEANFTGDQYVSNTDANHDNRLSNIWDTTFDTNSSNESITGSNHGNNPEFQSVNTNPNCVTSATIDPNCVTSATDDPAKTCDQIKLKQANRRWGIQETAKNQGPGSSKNFNDTHYSDNPCTSAGDGNPQTSHKACFARSDAANDKNSCTHNSKNNPFSMNQLMHLPRVRRDFIPGLSRIWLQTMESIFAMYGVTDDCQRYYMALQNISTVFLDRLTPYITGRSWKLLREGIQKVFGTLSYSQQLNAVESLTMSSTPRELLNQILSCLNLSYDSLSKEKEAFVRHLFLKKLPPSIKLSLQVISDKEPLDNVCEIAQKCYLALKENQNADTLFISEQQKSTLQDVKELVEYIRKSKSEPLNFTANPQRQSTETRFHTPQTYQNQRFYAPPSYRNQSNYSTRGRGFNMRYQGGGSYQPRYNNNNSRSQLQNSLNTPFQKPFTIHGRVVCKKHRKFGDQALYCDGQNEQCQYNAIFLEKSPQQNQQIT